MNLNPFNPKVLRFLDFINEAVSYGDKINVPPDFMPYLEQSRDTGRRKLSLFIGDAGVKGIYLKKDRLVFNIKGEEIFIPGIRYDERIILIPNELSPSSISKYMGHLVEKGIIKGNYNSHLIKEYDWRGNINKDYLYNLEKVIKDTIYFIIDTLSVSIKDKSLTINPFDIDLENNKLIKELKKLGSYINSNDIQIKNGNLIIDNDLYSYPVSIYRIGTIGYHKKYGGVLTNNPELTKPAYTVDDLNLKLTYVYFYTLKKILIKSGIKKEDVNQIMKYIKEGDQYHTDLITDLVEKYPILSILLPEPEGGFKKDLVAGASIINRFGGFDF